MADDAFDFNNLSDADDAGDESAGGSGPQSLPAAAAVDDENPRSAALKDNALVIGLFLAGIAAVYLLSLRGGPAEASAEQRAAEQQVESALDQLGRLPSGSTPGSKRAMEVVNTFYYEASQRQIPPDQLRDNPFCFHAPSRVETPAKTAPDPEPQTDPKVAAREKRLSEAMQAARSLQLQSILKGGDGAKALISNNLLSEGDLIQGWTIRKIESKQVLLDWKEHTYVLEMQK